MDNEETKCQNAYTLRGRVVTCGEQFDCCSCGGNECGCAYCFDCQACEFCIEEDNQ